MDTVVKCHYFVYRHCRFISVSTPRFESRISGLLYLLSFRPYVSRSSIEQPQCRNRLTGSSLDYDFCPNACHPPPMVFTSFLSLQTLSESVCLLDFPSLEGSEGGAVFSIDGSLCGVLTLPLRRSQPTDPERNIGISVSYNTSSNATIHFSVCNYGHINFSIIIHSLESWFYVLNLLSLSAYWYFSQCIDYGLCFVYRSLAIPKSEDLASADCVPNRFFNTAAVNWIESVDLCWSVVGGPSGWARLGLCRPGWQWRIPRH